MDGTDHMFYEVLKGIKHHLEIQGEHLNSIESEIMETNTLLKQLIEVLKDGIYTKKKYPEGMGPL